MKYLEEGLILTPGQVYLQTWDRTAEAYIKTKLSSNKLLNYLLKPIAEIEESFTLSHFMQLIKSSGLDVWDTLLPYWVAEYVEECLQGMPEGWVDEDPLLRLELVSMAEIEQGNFYTAYRFYGINKDGEHVGVDFVPSNELAYLPLTYSPNLTFSISDKPYSYKQPFTYQTQQPSITLLEFVSTIFSELSENGSPKERAEFGEFIGGLVEEAINNPEQMIPVDNLWKELEELDDAPLKSVN